MNMACFACRQEEMTTLRAHHIHNIMN